MASAELSIERIYQSPALEGSSPKSLKVSPDGKRVTFLKGKETDYERLDLWQYIVATGVTEMLLDSDDLHQGDEKLSDEEKARRERMRVHGSGILEYHWAKDGSALLFPLAGDAYYVRLADMKVQQLLATESFETDIRLSPKGNYISFIRDQNLLVKHIASGEELPISQNGGGTISYGMAEFVAQEEMGRMTGYWWSPDESAIAYTKVDVAPVQEVTRSEIYADEIKVIKQRYPAAGTPNVLVELAVQNLATKQIDWIDLGADKDIYLARVTWMPDSKAVTYQWQSRNQQELELRAYDLASKTQQVLLSERSDTWVNLNKDLRFLKSSAQFIWASERDGFKHLYLYNNDGSLERQLTQGDWVVDDIEAIDEQQQHIYFTGRKDTPIEKQLYRVGFAGKAIQRVSERQGFHETNFSDDATVYIDRFSTVNSPWQVSLHEASGKQLTWLAENAVAGEHPLLPYRGNWVKPEFGSFNTDDGATLYYRLYKPHGAEAKHPVIIYVYGGPHAQLVTDSWPGDRGLLMQYWLSRGYAVFTVDNRGSNYRGKAFEEPLYKKMGSIEVQDQIAGVEFLRSLPYVDPDRIGIYGHSYGGYMSLMSVFKAPGYFKAAVAGAPVTDWLLYDTHYTERYMGDPRLVPEAYEAASVFPYANKLENPLLIYHGMADDNVLFKNSTRLYKHLQDLAIPFEMMDYPGKKHSIRGKNTGIHLAKTITAFFDRHIGEQR